ncbi:MAG TPA: hypothetical protein ENN06_07605 [Desulfobacteraceae bacterium]|nr:hypothetical protein [Desulfobacteraceae bacterium]
MTGKNHTVEPINLDQPAIDMKRKPLLVAEGLHVLHRLAYEAVTGRDGAMLRRLALHHLRTGAQALAVNLGTGRTMRELTPWVIASLAEWTDVPLFVSANILDHPAILRSLGHRIVVNAVTADPASLSLSMRIAEQYGTGLAVLLVRPGLTPRGVDDRLLLAAEVLDLAYRVRLPFSRLYLDPVLACRPDPFAWHVSRGLPDIGSTAESISLIKGLDTGVRTIAALGAGAREAGVQKGGRTGAGMLSLLTAAGVDAVILNCKNTELMAELGPRSWTEARDADSGGLEKTAPAA